MPIELRNSIVTQLPDRDGKKWFSADHFIGAVQMRDTPASLWQDIDPSIEELDVDGSTINFTQTPMFVKVGKDGKRRIYPDRTDLSFWVEFQKPFASMGKPTRLDRWFYWNFAHAILGIRVDNTCVKFGFRLKDNLAPTSITIPFMTQGITRQGKLLYHGGEVVASLRQPIATGSNLDAMGRPVQKDCNITFAAGSVTISLDPTGLTYPIEIDPSLDYQVTTTTANDGDVEYGNAYFYTNNAVDQVGDYYGAASSFGRWTAVTIPVGATIGANTYVSYYVVNYGGTATNCHTRLFFNLSSDAVAPTTAATYNAKTVTTAYTDYTPAAWASGWYNIDAHSQVAELVAAYDFSAGKAMMALYKDNGSTNTAYLSLNDYSNDTASAAKLHIEYTSGGTTWYGAAVLPGKGLMTVIGSAIWQASAVLSGIGTLAVIGRQTLKGASTLAGIGAITVAGQLWKLGQATLAGIGNLTAIGRNILTGASSLVGIGTVSTIGRLLLTGQSVLTGIGNLAVTGRLTLSGIASLIGNGALNAVGRLTLAGQSLLNGIGNLNVGASLILTGQSILTGIGNLTVTGSRTVTGLLTMAGVGTLSAVGQLFIGASAVLSGIGDLTVTGGRWVYGVSSLTGIGFLSVIGDITAGIIHYGQAVLTGIGNLSIIGRRTVTGAVSLPGIGELTISAISHKFRTIFITLSLHSRSLIAKLYSRTGIVKLYKRNVIVSLPKRDITVSLKARATVLKTKVK